MLVVIRIRFSKTGYARYISHLDLARYISRVLRRSGIPVWYTQGFNPRAHMVFSPPLSVGIAGLNEILDIKLDNPMSTEEIKERLSANMAQGFEVSEVYETETQLKNIAFAEYNLRFELKDKALIDSFWNRPEIEVIKKSKSSSQTINLKIEATVTDIYEKNNQIIYKIILPCGNERNINPLLFIEALVNFNNGDIAFNIERKDFLYSNYEIFR
jgi:radical SAM-linked protein